LASRSLPCDAPGVVFALSFEVSDTDADARLRFPGQAFLSRSILLMDEIQEAAHDAHCSFSDRPQCQFGGQVADDVLLMDRSNLLAAGSPAEVLKSRTWSEAYSFEREANRTPIADLPFVLPLVCSTVCQLMVSRDTMPGPIGTT